MAAQNGSVPHDHVHTVVVVGAGMSGILVGSKLKKAGIEDFVILERDHEVGGTWLQNRYPGLEIDVPMFTYQYRSAPNPKWSKMFPQRDEILQYLKDSATSFGLRPHIRFGRQIVREQWNDEEGLWEITSASGETVKARFVISAVGAFITPKEDPGIAGWQDFQGKTLRTATWDYDYNLVGKRVAIIGTGSSSVQITPSIAPTVGHLDVYQRTAAWVSPKPDYELSPRTQRLLALPGVQQLVMLLGLTAMQGIMTGFVYAPSAQFQWLIPKLENRLHRWRERRTREIVKDQDTAAKLVAKHGILYKRPVLSNTYLESFNRDNVGLVTTPIDRITENGIRTVDGVEHHYDAIVLATGYELFSDPETYKEGAVLGRNGFDLGKFYNQEQLHAYQGVMLPELPNRWTLIGPNSWYFYGWQPFIEGSTNFAVKGIVETLDRGARAIAVTPEATAKFRAKVDKLSRNFNIYFHKLNSGSTYYVNSHGDMVFFRPTTFSSHVRQSKRFAEADYRFDFRRSKKEAKQAAPSVPAEKAVVGAVTP